MLYILLKGLTSNTSLVRLLLNIELKHLYLEGSVLDLGSGGSDIYSKYIPRDTNSEYILFDNKTGKDFVNFERDQLPYKNNQFDTVLLFNILEHLYNPHNILKEIKRIKKKRLIGFVPFLMWYHPDPHDYMRYTDEALIKLLEEHRYKVKVMKPLTLGAYTTAFQMIHTTLPVFLRPFVFIPLYLLDIVFRKLRPHAVGRYALGYYFEAR